MMRILASVALVLAPLWAGEIQAPGVPNFHQVNEHIYRGGQPTDAGWNSLAGLGIKTVIDLRPPGEHPAGLESKSVEGKGMHYVNVPMKEFGAPPDEEISKVLSLFDSGELIFVHCRRGSDRTGTVIACYRIAHDHWDTRKALQEARSYGLSQLERAMKRYIVNFKPVEPATGAPELNPVAARPEPH